MREIEPADVDGILRLFDGLADEDRRSRFFNYYRPDRDFVERMTTVADRGGCGLVATVRDRAGEDLVAEIGYSLMPNGDGELGVTVAAPWRGWLGPCLFDALVDAARRRGVPNLEADVLVSNRPMIRVLRARGFATIDHPDWSVVRIVVGTGSDGPHWPAGERRPRVLVEGGGGRWRGEAEARRAGLDVIVCPGPGQRGSPCPALAGTPCPLVTGADAVVLAPPGDDDGWPRLADAHREIHRGIPVCIDIARRDARAAERYGHLPRVDERGAVQFLQRFVTSAQQTATPPTG